MTHLLHCGTFLALSLAASATRADLLIYHIDVGMGDATLIVETSKKRSLLVDAGNRGYGKKVVAPFLKDLGYTSINYFVATHYDSDHIGGFDELRENEIQIGRVYDRGDYTTRGKTTAKGNPTQYGEYLEAAHRYGRHTLLVCNRDGGDIDLGEASVEVVASRGSYLVEETESSCTSGDAKVSRKKDNDLSIALRIAYKDFSYFIGGDLTGGGNRTTDMETLVAPAVGDVDVLRLNHHGSLTSSNERFLRELSPEVAIISVGNGGVNLGYRLPRQEVLDRLSKITSKLKLFLTNRGEGGSLPDQRVGNGHIVVYTDGVSYTVNGQVFKVDERADSSSR